MGKQNGLALLETASILFVLTMLSAVCLGLWSGLSEAAHARHAVEAALRTGVPKPYKVLTPGGLPLVTLNKKAVEAFTDTVSSRLIAEMNTRGLHYHFDVMAAEVPIDAHSGKTSGSFTEILSARRTGGSLSPSAAALAETDLRSAAETWAAVLGPNNAALIAVPKALRGQAADGMYVDRVLIVAARVIALLGGDYVSAQWRTLTGSYEVRAANMVLLRADFE